MVGGQRKLRRGDCGRVVGEGHCRNLEGGRATRAGARLQEGQGTIGTISSGSSSLRGVMDPHSLPRSDAGSAFYVRP